MSTKDANALQHAKLRKRLEEELSYVKSSSDSADFDWFLRGPSLRDEQQGTQQPAAAGLSSTNPAAGGASATPVSPLKSPSMANSRNNKAAPSVSASGSGSGSANSRDPELVSLSRSKTADAKLISPISRTSTNSSSAGLHRTSTNVETSDIGRSRNKKPYTPPVANTAPLSPPSEKKKRGFFKKLFGSKAEDTKPESNIYKTQSNVSTTSTAPLSRTASRTEPSLSRSRSQTQPVELKKVVSASNSSTAGPVSSSNASSISKSKSRSGSFLSSDSTRPDTVRQQPSPPAGEVNGAAVDGDDDEASVEKTEKILSLAEQYKDIDSQLSTYLNELETSNVVQENDEAEKKEKDYNYIYSPVGIEGIRYDSDEVPPHPDTPKLPSAFASKPRFGGSLEKELFLKQKKEREEKESSVFGSLLHKTKTSTPESLFYSGMINESDDTPPFSFEPLHYSHPPPKLDKRPPLKTFSDVKPMKKVAFATTTFVTDPPQQIPSRNPRKGNVEICANGELIIHKIDPQEKLNAATGIVVGGSGPLRLIAETDTNDSSTAETSNIQIDVPNAAAMQKTPSSMSIASQSSHDQTIKSEDRILAAKKAREHHEGSENIDIQKESFKIDKPMVKRKKHMEKPVVTLKMDELYTRCCHLREILPIPATLKQIPKGSIDPIPYIHLRNPRPSMIEILSFTDFIRIAPVICVSLDGVSLTREMFRILLSSLLYKRYLEKLSLRNTPIDEEGWKMLCLFLSMNKALKKLDITQCPSLDVNTQRIKKKSKLAAENRMTCNVNDRSDKNWALLTASLIYRGGIDEVILTGCKIPDLQLFSNFLNLALVKTTRIGLAYNELSLQHCFVVARWLRSNPSVIGIDLAYNDLSSKLKPFIEYANEMDSENNLMMLSLNSCNLIDCQETRTFFNVLSKIPHLTYLDVSGNSKLMKTFLSKLSIYLPLLTNLGRLNIDNNQLDETLMIRFLESIPLVPNLNYLSITGNEMNETVSEALCKALRNSKTLYSVNIDEDKVDADHQEKIGLLTMRNVERQLYKRKGEYKGEKKTFFDIVASNDREEIRKSLGLAEGQSFTETLSELIKSNDVDEETLEKFLAIVNKVRGDMKQVIQDLINTNLKNELSLQGKEMLIRLMSMSASIDKALELINNKKLNSLKDGGSFDVSKYKELAKHNFEREQDPSLDAIVKELKEKYAGNYEDLKSFILSTNDPYDLISMLKGCKASDIKISDLFLKKYTASPDSSIQHLDANLDDDASIDSVELESDSGDNNRMLHIYDKILKELLAQSKQ